MSRRLVVHLVLAATTVAVFAPVLGRGLMLYDLGELVFYADKIRSGATPGNDYVVNGYGPGRYVVVAGLWELFGRSFAPVWGLFLALRIGIAALAWELARRYVGPAWAVLPVVCLWVAPGPLHKGFFLLGTLAIALALVVYLEEPGRRRAIALGVGVALAGWFRLDLGLFGLLAAAFAMGGVAERRADLAVASAPLLGGLLGTALQLGLRADGVVAAVLGQVRADVLVNQQIAHPRLPGLGSLVAFDSLDPWLIWSPVAVYGGLFALLARAMDWSDEQAVRRRKVAAVLLLGVLTCNQVRMKPEVGHLLQAGPMLWLAVTLLLSRQQARGEAFGQAWRVRAAQLAGVALPLVLAAHVFAEHRGELYTGSFTIGEERTLPLETPLGTALLNPGEHEVLQGTLDALAQLPDGPMWVPTNQPLLYALADRADVTGYPTVLYFAGSRERERQVIERLSAARPPVVVFVDDTMEGPERLLSHAAPLVHGYLFASYEEISRTGGFAVMLRTDLVRQP